MSAPYFTFKLTVAGEEVVSRMLKDTAARAHNLAPAMPAVVRMFQAVVARAFKTEGASSTFPWAPLAERTQRQRAALGLGAAHPILERTGKLKRALTLGEGAYSRITSEGVAYILSAEVGYFIYHQSTAPRKRLPRRPPVRPTEREKHFIVRPVVLYVSGRDPDLATIPAPYVVPRV